METTDRFETYKSQLSPALQKMLRRLDFGCFGEYCDHEHWKRYREGVESKHIYIRREKKEEHIYVMNKGGLRYVHPEEYENL